MHLESGKHLNRGCRLRRGQDWVRRNRVKVRDAGSPPRRTHRPRMPARRWLLWL